MKLRKKAQVGGLQGFILSIITVAIVLAIGLIVLTEMQDAAKVIQEVSTINNESVAGAARVVQGGELFVGASACRNGTMVAYAIGTGCNVSSIGVISYNLSFAGDTGFIDYTHYTPSAAYNSSKTIISKLATVPTWIGIIIIISLAFIVLSFFIGKRQ